MIRFIVQGTPTSSQKTGRHDRWTQAVKGSVPEETEVLRGMVKLSINYCFKDATDLDVDNITKHILDALNNSVYVDDSQVVDLRVRKFSFGELQEVPGGALPDTVRKEANEQPHEFVYVWAEPASERISFK